MRSAECGCGLVTAGHRTRDGYLKRIRETQEDRERCNTKTERWREGSLHRRPPARVHTLYFTLLFLHNAAGLLQFGNTAWEIR